MPLPVQSQKSTACRQMCREVTANRNNNFFAISGLQKGVELLLWGPFCTWQVSIPCHHYRPEQYLTSVTMIQALTETSKRCQQETPFRQKQTDFCEFESSLVCKEFRTARTTHRNPALKSKQARERESKKERERIWEGEMSILIGILLPVSWS